MFDHNELMNLFLKKCDKKLNIEQLYNKRPILGANFMYNRIVIITSDLVYKIHPVEYTEKQKELVKNLKLFFKNYSQPLDITEHYKEDLCWTTWIRVSGELLGKGHLKDHVWAKYLNYIIHVWDEHRKKSITPKEQMWWHYDVTPWNVIVQSDDSFFLIDWDDFRLMDIKEAKQWTINQNIEYAKINDQDQNLIRKILGDLK